MVLNKHDHTSMQIPESFIFKEKQPEQTAQWPRQTEICVTNKLQHIENVNEKTVGSITTHFSFSKKSATQFVGRRYTETVKGYTPESHMTELILRSSENYFPDDSDKTIGKSPANVVSKNATTVTGL